ncbi:ribonuclease H-like domain-containing protein [Tanacetum coccineum]
MLILIHKSQRFSTLKQSTAEPTNIPKGYTQAASSKVPTAPNYASHSDEIICSFFSQQASMPTTHDDEDLLQIDEDAMEEIDIRWQVAMITARIRKFMRKTGRPIDLKPKNGITFDKSKIECFNCQKLGHFARECRFAKYQENRANGRQEKKTVAIEDSNSKALVATDNNEDIDWTKEFDAEPVTYAMMALTGVEQDDWSMEFDAEHVHFGQDGLGDFDWSNKADDAPVSLALMATNSEGNPEEDLKDYAIIDSGCSGSMTGDKDKLSDFKEFKGGYVAFGNDSKGGRISGKGTIKTSCLDFEKVSYVEELKFNLLSVSQICDKKHNVLFTDKECLILSPKFKFVDEDLVILRAPRKNDVYSLDLKNIIPSGGITCLVAKATEANLVKGLPSKTIKLDHSLVPVESKFKNQLMNEFCAKKGIKREYSIARTPQQNGVAERKNRTLIEAARTMLADSLLPIQFWAEAVNTACYEVLKSVVTKPQMKTPYEILMGRSPNISFMRPFGCPLTILNTLDHLGKFDGKSEEGYLLGYSTNSKGFRVYNRVTRKVQDCLHVNFLENQENQKGKGPDWMFDLDLLTPSMNYIPVRKENYADSKEQGITCDDAEDLDDQQFIVHTTQPMPPEERTAAKEVKLSSEEQALHDELISLMNQESLAKAHNDDQRIAFEEEKRRISIAKGKEHVDSTFTLSTANTPPQSTGNTPTDSDDDTPTDGVFSTNSFDAEEGGVADYNNLDSTIDVPSTPTLRIHKIHPQSQIIGKSTAGVQTRRKLQDSTSNQHQALLSFIYKQNRTNHKDQQTCLFACFLSQEEPKKVSQALADESWVEAMQEELLQFKLQEVWVLCDLPEGKRVIGTKWVFRNKRDERGTIIKNKARLVAQGYRQEEGVDYDESSRVRILRSNAKGIQDEFMVNSLSFIGLQVKQSNGGIFSREVRQYVKDILNKFDFRTIKPASTPIEAHKSLGKDEKISSHSKDFPFYMLSKGSLAFFDSDYAVTTMTEDQLQEMSISLAEDSFMSMYLSQQQQRRRLLGEKN